MRILIVEDEILIADFLRQCLISYGYEVIGIAEDVDKAKVLLFKEPDLVFVDIQLANEQSGIDLGNHLSLKGVPFIYLTANNEIHTIKKAAVTKPETYLTKPFNKHDIVAAIELIRSKKSDAEQKRFIIKTVRGDELLNYDDVLFVKADGVYVEINTISRVVTQRMTLKDFMEGCSCDNFIKVHRSYAVNKIHVTSKKSTKVYLGDIEIPVSKSFTLRILGE